MGKVRSWIPSFIKPLFRFLYYKQERVKVSRERKIRKIQDERIKQFSPSARKLIVFLVPGADYDTGTDKISGGIISIVSLCEETKKLAGIHKGEVLMCTFPGQYLLEKHTQFKNDTDVFRLDQLEQYFREVDEILLHIPEYWCNHFVGLVNNGEFSWLTKGRLHINVLNQNIRFMPTAAEISELKKIAREVTATTAHQQYCTQYYRDLYGIPLHKFSVWISPEKYSYRSYSEKLDLMIVSPDPHPDRNAVLEKLSAIPGLRLQVIQNLTYEQYKEVISNAKWSLTFGEGLDGYLIEPVFSGAIAFAVYNKDFFTSDFEDLPTIYESMDVLVEKIAADLQQLDEELHYKPYQKKQFNLCARYYSQEAYRQNLLAFYKKEYTYAK
jgi:hypothetical protein